MPDRNVIVRVIIIVTGLAVLLTGIVLLATYKSTTVISSQYIKHYDNCEDAYNIACKSQRIQPEHPCTCIIPFQIKEQMLGQVNLYYELETYNQMQSDYRISKDDEQLAGVLSTPAESCGNYSYVETDGKKMPIAPCGAIADSMLTDRFNLIYGDIYLSCIDTGLDGILEEDKKLYHNPAGDLKEAFENFSKPRSWHKNIWELDTSNSSNNGFQNEFFIAWMKTDLKRKPICRINHTGIFEEGLPAGTYEVRVEYLYPPSLYSGERAIIIASVYTDTYYRTTNLVIGIICIIIGLASLVAYFLIRKFNISSFRNREG